MSTEYKTVLTHHYVFCCNTVITPLLFLCSTTPATVHPLTTIHSDWYVPINTPTIQVPTMLLLPCHPEALREVATSIGDSMTAFEAIWGDAVAQCICSCLQLVEGSFGFEITVYGVYVVLGFLSFLRY
jgi:hypothetical protein